MTPERKLDRRAYELFEQALERPSEERPAFLTNACRGFSVRLPKGGEVKERFAQNAVIKRLGQLHRIILTRTVSVSSSISRRWSS